jgi:hypothetical protein
MKDVDMMSDMRILAEELRRVRTTPPATVGDAMGAYAIALANARARRVNAPLLLLAGEILWLAIRPEDEPVPEKIAATLDGYWKKSDADLAACTPRTPA